MPTEQRRRIEQRRRDEQRRPGPANGRSSRPALPPAAVATVGGSSRPALPPAAVATVRGSMAGVPSHQTPSPMIELNVEQYDADQAPPLSADELELIYEAGQVAGVGLAPPRLPDELGTLAGGYSYSGHRRGSAPSYSLVAYGADFELAPGVTLGMMQCKDGTNAVYVHPL